MSATNVNAGDLNRRVTLWVDVQAPDAYGQLQPTPTSLGTFWAAIRTPTGREAIVAAQFKAQLTHVVTMRYLGLVAIGPAAWLIYHDVDQDRDRRFNLLGPPLNVDERRRQYDVHAQEVTLTPEPNYPAAGGG